MPKWLSCENGNYFASYLRPRSGNSPSFDWDKTLITELDLLEVPKTNALMELSMQYRFNRVVWWNDEDPAPTLPEAKLIGFEYA
jgi:hypothetical protein